MNKNLYLSFLILVLLIGALLRFVNLDYGKDDPVNRPDDDAHLAFVLDLVTKAIDLQDVKNPGIPSWGPNFVGLNLVQFFIDNRHDLFQPEKSKVREFLIQTIAAPQNAIMLIRTSSAILSTASLILVFLIARMLFGNIAGVLAAGVCAVSPLLITEAKTAKEDSLLLFLLLLNFFLLFLYLKKRKSIYLLLGAFVCGFAFGVKIVGILMLPIYGVVFLKDFFSQRSNAGILCEVNFLLIKWYFGVFFFIGYAFLNFYLLLSPISVLRTFLNMFSTFGPKANVSSNTPFFLFQVLPYGIGWVVSALAFVAVIYFLLKKNWSALSLAAICGMLLVLLNKSPLVFDRYILFLIPAAAILAFGFIASVVSGKSALVRFGVLGVVFLIAVWQTLPKALATNELLGRPSTRKVAGDFLRQQMVNGQSALILRFNFWLGHGPMYGLNPIKRDWFNQPAWVEIAKKHVHFDNIEFLSIANLGNRKPDWVLVEYLDNGWLSLNSEEEMKKAEALLSNGYIEVFSTSPAKEFGKVKFNSWHLPVAGLEYAQSYGPRIKVFKRVDPEGRDWNGALAPQAGGVRDN